MLISELQNENGEYNSNPIEVKPYISWIEKKILCEQVIDGCMEENTNGIVSCDFSMKQLIKDLKIVSAYSGIEFEDEVVNDYDFLIQNGILKNIKSRINRDELDFIDEMINCGIKQKIEIDNSLSNIIASKLQVLIERFPTDKQIKSLSKSLVKDINKMDWDKVPMLKQMWETANGKSGDKVGK
jgi:hypothetical protein